MAFHPISPSTANLFSILTIFAHCLLFHGSNAFCFHQEPGDRFWTKMDCPLRGGNKTLVAPNHAYGMPPCFVGTNCTVASRDSYWKGDIRGCVSEIFCGVAHSDLDCKMRICRGPLCNGMGNLRGIHGLEWRNLVATTAMIALILMTGIGANLMPLNR